jgi:tight adherence protein C
MPLTPWIAVTGVFLTVAVLAGAVTSWLLIEQLPERRRLRTITQAPAVGVVVESRGLTDSPDPTVARVSKILPKTAKDMSRLQRRLARAGYPKFEHAVYFSIAELLLPVICAGAVISLMGVRDGWMFAILIGALGYLLPGLYITRLVALRQRAIQNGLPDALDLLTVCVEAGSGLDQAIAKASDELQLAHPILAEELRTVTTETRAGKRRFDALKNFAQRTGVDDVRTLVAMLIQTDRFGTSIGQALRSHAETSRTKRRQHAEERAAKISVKLVFPLALCLFPALYVVCFGPVVVQIYRTLLGGGL